MTLDIQLACVEIQCTASHCNKTYLSTDGQGPAGSKARSTKEAETCYAFQAQQTFVIHLQLWHRWILGHNTNITGKKKLRGVVPYNMYIYNQHGSLAQKPWHTWCTKKPCMYMQSSYWETADAENTQNKENQKIHQWFEAVTKLFWSMFRGISSQRMESYHGLFTMS